ncbi:hypothetical protein AACH06_24810 [Ideonella sp. DXS29W]|uniref:Glycoside hydrolase n=1 Tax=Ideonella lacteola TaxID=2984193 RepID=A0ABU9BVR8_9BURK
MTQLFQWARLSKSVRLALLASAGVLAVGVAGAGLVPNGVNLQPSYYNGGNVNFGWTLMRANPKIGSVRIEVEPGMEAQAATWLAQARSNGLKAIVTYHKWTVLGSNSSYELNQAADWWKRNYSKLRASGSFRVNLMNEWGDHNLSANDYATAYNAAIATVRTVYKGPIVIDAPGWGQETAIAAAALKGYNGGVKITDTKVVPSMHVYPGAWNQAKNRWLNTSDVDDLASAGRGLIVGEFGSGGSGGADWVAITDYARSKGYSVLGWAWNGDGGFMNMVTPSWNDNPTATAFSKSSYWSTIYDRL